MFAGSSLVLGARATARGLIDLLMPPACVACKAPVATALGFCAGCWAALPTISGARCVQCSIPLPVQWQAESHCLGCLNEPPRFDRTFAPCLYAGPARQVVLGFKNGREAYAPLMADAMLRAAGNAIAPDMLVCAVPLHRWRLAARGYNQALLLARKIASHSGAPVDPDLLLRVKSTARTRGLSRAQRRRNVQGAFSLATDGRNRIGGRHVVLVDDVMTSGATASAAAAVLKRGGAAAVTLLVYARVAATEPAPYVGSTSDQDDHGQG